MKFYQDWFQQQSLVKREISTILLAHNHQKVLKELKKKVHNGLLFDDNNSQKEKNKIFSECLHVAAQFVSEWFDDKQKNTWETY